MDVLKINTNPIFFIVPRKNIAVTDVIKFVFTNEMTQKTQSILSSLVELLPNETYKITLDSFPTGKAGEKLSYTMSNNATNEVLSLGKAIILLENENVQDYSKQSNNKFYK